MIQDFQNIFTDLSIVQITTLVIFFVLFLLRTLYLFLVTGRVLFCKRRNKEGKLHTPVTIVFTPRNEEEHIRNILPQLLDIEGLDFEVVVVDDFSQDNSYSVLGLLNQRYGRLKISSLNQETRFSVKLAQNIALKSASNNWVLITPIALGRVTGEWLSGMSGNMEDKKIDLVLGYSSVVREKSMFNLLYRIENFYQQIKQAGYIGCGVAFVYAEDNLAFKKENYFQRGGYGKNIKEQYANLELVVNSFITKRNSVVDFTPSSAICKDITIKRAEYFDLINKSYRIEKHLSAVKRLFLFFDSVTNLLYLPIIMFTLFLVFPVWPLVTLLAGVKLLVHVLIIKSIQNRLNERKIFIPSLLYGLLMPYYKLFYKWHFNRPNGKYK
uniref:glycosyltransferase n=1 Tax=uncultured Draconibacterium sp. TaxID=1573823 RepID=UPI00321631FA